MTLILALITPRFAALVSDRRITSPRRAADKSLLFVVNDSDTKSIVLDQRYVMGFAGLGTVGRDRLRMESWLATAIGYADTEDRFELLADNFGKVCEKVRYMGHHTFLAVGYREDSDGVNCPEMVVVSNSFSGDSRIIKPEPNYPHSFDVLHLPLSSFQKYLLLTAGSEVQPAVMQDLHRSLQRLTGRHEVDIHKLRPILLNVIRQTAQNDIRVGGSGIMTTFPASAVPLKPGADVWIEPPPSRFYKTDEISTTFTESDDDAADMFLPARIGDLVMVADQASRGRFEELGPLDRVTATSPFQRTFAV